MIPIKSCLSFDSLLPIFVTNQKKKKGGKKRKRLNLREERKNLKRTHLSYSTFLMQGGL